MRSEGLSYGQIAERLNEEGFSTRTGARFGAAQVFRIERRA
jgi:hypothetical protein